MNIGNLTEFPTESDDTLCLYCGFTSDPQSQRAHHWKDHPQRIRAHRYVQELKYINRREAVKDMR